jgi:hypothetical protein
MATRAPKRGSEVIAPDGDRASWVLAPDGDLCGEQCRFVELELAPGPIWELELDLVRPLAAVQALLRNG